MFLATRKTLLSCSGIRGERNADVVSVWSCSCLGVPATAGIPRSLRIAPPYVFDEGGGQVADLPLPYVPLFSNPPLGSRFCGNDGGFGLGGFLGYDDHAAGVLCVGFGLEAAVGVLEG